MKVLLVDDEPLARQRLRRLLSDCPGWEVCAEAGDGQSAWEALESHQPDVLLLDIRMPGMDGVELSRRLLNLPTPPAVIFCTAHAEHALQAFQTVATAYLLKPVNKHKLRAALDKVQLTTRAQPIRAPAPGPQLELRRGMQQWRVPLQRVYLLQAEDKLTMVYHSEGSDHLSASLNQLEQQYPQLLRVHRQTLVNPDHVQALLPCGRGRYQIQLAVDLPPVAVSRRLLAQVRRRLAQSASPHTPGADIAGKHGE